MVGRGEVKQKKLPSLETLKRTEWSKEFESLMRNRLIMGAMRYGRLGKPKPKWDRLSSIAKKVSAFKQDKNKELLVDIANLCLVEFVEGEGYFTSADDEDHTEEKG